VTAFARIGLGLVGAAVAAGCGSLPGGRPRELPAEAFAQLCRAFAEEPGFDAAAPIVVPKQTRPIYQSLALRLVHQPAAVTLRQAESDERRDASLRESFEAMRLSVPAEGGKCRWERPGSEEAPAAEGSELMLELSNVTEDPFASSGEPRWGVFARLSLGGRPGASWYWVALQARGGGGWMAREAIRLDVSDG
jgi:hypothetical protein